MKSLNPKAVKKEINFIWLISWSLVWRPDFFFCAIVTSETKMQDECSGSVIWRYESHNLCFSRKDEWIEMNPSAYDCLVRNAEKIQEKNYVAWADFMEKTNSEDEKKPGSKDASLYLQILRKTFLTGLPVLLIISPLISQLLKID